MNTSIFLNNIAVFHTEDILSYPAIERRILVAVFVDVTGKSSQLGETTIRNQNLVYNLSIDGKDERVFIPIQFVNVKTIREVLARIRVKYTAKVEGECNEHSSRAYQSGVGDHMLTELRK